MLFYKLKSITVENCQLYNVVFGYMLHISGKFVQIIKWAKNG